MHDAVPRVSPRVREVMAKRAFTKTEIYRRLTTISDCDEAIDKLMEERATFDKQISESVQNRAEAAQQREEAAAIDRFVQDFPPSSEAREFFAPDRLQRFNHNRYFLGILRRRKAELRDAKDASGDA